MIVRKKKFKSEAFESIHSAAKALHDIGAIDKMTMRNYDALCVQAPTLFEASTIRSLRESYKISQPVFAGYLNVSKSTVEKWESGDKKAKWDS